MSTVLQHLMSDVLLKAPLAHTLFPCVLATANFLTKPKHVQISTSANLT